MVFDYWRSLAGNRWPLSIGDRWPLATPTILFFFVIVIVVLVGIEGAESSIFVESRKTMFNDCQSDYKMINFLYKALRKQIAVSKYGFTLLIISFHSLTYGPSII